MNFLKNKTALILVVVLIGLLSGCTNNYEDAIKQAKVGELWQDPLCEWTTRVESNEKWDKYVYKEIMWRTLIIYYTVDKQGKILSIWHYRTI